LLSRERNVSLALIDSTLEVVVTVYFDELKHSQTKYIIQAHAGDQYLLSQTDLGSKYSGSKLSRTRYIVSGNFTVKSTIRKADGAVNLL